ncbi:hypothetical protein [Paractinoplanes rishiriensis]|uniref:Uncharacterized protein n=1 Tax=Paractinoplanes rishiriensis TaxID=1050105 RepID=A0A919K3T0_9ACTN|nr:hypothetical protein [Actinoplanes rishiriensis]GIE99673.1 hypothetical protein Ari01nite_71380 [Actinoplanes rishiriensis]
MLTGTILAESLRVGSDLSVPSLRVVRIRRDDVSASSTPTQPDVFTVLQFEADDAVADQLADALAEMLIDGPNWYADFRAGAEHVVVFPGRIFRYAVGDEDGRAAAVAYGRQLGIPEPQLDWR